MARSYEPLWLWLGGGFVAVGAALPGVAGGFDAASKVPYSFATSTPMIVAYVLFGLSLACFGCAIREVPIPYPIGGRKTEPLAPPVERPTPERPAISAAHDSGLPAAGAIAAPTLAADASGQADHQEVVMASTGRPGQRSGRQA